MDESTARHILLVRAFETSAEEHPLWTSQDRRWATRVALETTPAHGNAASFLSTRAEAALRRLAPKEPRLTTWLSHPLWQGRWVLAAVLLGLLLGLAADAVGPSHRINLLAPVFWGLILWNLLVYAWTVLPLPQGWLRRTLARRTLDLHSLLRGAKREPVLAQFAQQWFTASAPLALARAGVLVHTASAGLALGLIAGLYLRGLVLDYRVGWASTFLEAPAVLQWLQVTLHPAQWLQQKLHLYTYVTDTNGGLLAWTMPDAAGLEALRWTADTVPTVPTTASAAPAPLTPASSAAPWIHLYALTLLAWVVLPRTLLALVCAGRAAWWSRRFPLTLDADPYFDQLLRQQRREQARVTLLPYAMAPEPAHVDTLREWLRPLLGELMQWQQVPQRSYGSEDEVALQQSLTGKPTLMLPMVDLSATPEDEVHGRWLRALQNATASAGKPRFVLVLEEGSFAQRFGTSAPERLSQRRQAWYALASGLGMGCLPVRQGVPVEPAATELRRQLDGEGPGMTASPVTGTGPRP